MLEETNYQGETVSQNMWEQCRVRLSEQLAAHDMSTWIDPLQAVEDGELVRLFAPNEIIADAVRERFMGRIKAQVESLSNGSCYVTLLIGSATAAVQANTGPRVVASSAESVATEQADYDFGQQLNRSFTFSNFVTGKPNEFAAAAAEAVANDPASGNNPLAIYGGVGLGKTHLMHAVGNAIKHNKPEAKVVYLHSETFVNTMISALRHGKIESFKRYFRSADALLLDDVQFFAGKERSQEELFHTFNALLERKTQVVLSCDCYPAQLDGVEDRLRSRFGWGLTVAIDPPDLEMRAAILESKAEELGYQLPSDASMFVAQRLPTNVRELEGALRRMIAAANFRGKPLDIQLARETLQDAIVAQDQRVSVDSIQKAVAEYFSIRVSDLTSATRSRSIARPRQLAMAMAKELTNHSLPEIGRRFGGRDHTTVMHAVKKVKQLCAEDNLFAEDFKNIRRSLTSG